jgi:diguanylate cyclase (GGDEF)-like protein
MHNKDKTGQGGDSASLSVGQRGRRAYDELASGSQLIARHRDGYRYALLLLAVALAPVNTHHVLVGQWLPAVAGFTLLIVLLINFWQLTRGREALIPAVVMILLTLAMIVLSAYYGQAYSLYWMYPLLVALPVLLSTRWAVWLAILCGMVATPLAFMQHDLGTAIVICLSMLHTWLISAWLVYVVTQQAQQLKDIALTDPLTGAYNRRYFQHQAHRAIDIFRRFDRPASLLLLDIDYFKEVNDRYGHTVGDAALRAVVALLQQRLRSVDTLCRFGGEEFVLLLNETDESYALQVAQELRQMIAQADILPQGAITVSIGVCQLALSQNLDQWLQCVDKALYRAKDAGRNRVVVGRSGVAASG